MHTWIGAGGSSWRVLEAVLHLCAAGLGPPELRLLMIEPDKSNGNAERTLELIGKYQALQQRFAGKLGDKALNLFGTTLDLLPDGQQQGLKIWSPMVQGQAKRLRDLLQYDNLRSDDPRKSVAHLLFTHSASQSELSVDLDQGFLGHTAIGAAAMSLIWKERNRQPWQQLLQKITGDITDRGESRVFLVGSVFGGTGASAIYPVGQFLRAIPSMNPNIKLDASTLKIGVAALVPYFGFLSPPVDEADHGANDAIRRRMAAKSEWFPLATRAAVEFYHHLQTHSEWPFDAMFWVGDNNLFQCADYALGGPQQKNPAHFVDFLAALASLEFLHMPVANKASYYAGPAQQNQCEWADLPLRHFSREEIQYKLLQFFLIGAVHLGFGNELLQYPQINSHPFYVPWYLKRFTGHDEYRLTNDKPQESLRLLAEYFACYHFPWWDQMHEPPQNMQLFNRVFRPIKNGCGVDLVQLASLLTNGASLLQPR
jgi:hypothetical protein